MSSTTTSNKTEDSQLSLTGMGTQLGINAAIAVGILCLFNILRPNNSRMMIFYIYIKDNLYELYSLTPSILISCVRT